MNNPDRQKVISVGIIGKPNAGKSTLLNYIIGEKISIVTPKVQTTRTTITGIVTKGNTQLILFDTPGIFEPTRYLEKAMVRCAWSTISGVDITLLIIDGSKRPDDGTKKILAHIKERNIPVVFLFNKIDIKSKNLDDNKLYIRDNFTNPISFEISALTGKGINTLFAFLKSKAKDSPWSYDENDMTDLPSRFLACEITREQLFLQLHQELPYNLTVESESWSEQSDGSVKINQVIVVSKNAYKSIILGYKGQKIKEIGMKARENIENLLGQKVHLFLFVKVRKNWDTNPDYFINFNK